MSVESFEETTELNYEGLRKPCNNVLEELKRRAGGEFQGPPEVIAQFEKVFKILPELSQQILAKYIELSKLRGQDLPDLDLVMVGGRSKGKPFKETSDIDLNFATSDTNKALDRVTDYSAEDAIFGATEWTLMLRKYIKKLCDDNHIPNDLFHIYYYGAKKQDEYGAGALLLASYKSKELDQKSNSLLPNRENI